MTYDDAHTTARDAIGEAIRLWAGARMGDLLDDGLTEAEARAAINRVMASPEFLRWANEQTAAAARWMQEPSAPSKGLQ